jgi:hypothetical protein
LPELIISYVYDGRSNLLPPLTGESAGWSAAGPARPLGPGRRPPLIAGKAADAENTGDSSVMIKRSSTLCCTLKQIKNAIK